MTGSVAGSRAYPALAEIAGLELTAAHCRALPDARAIARLAALRWHQGAALDAADLVPLYLRDKVALTEARARGVIAVSHRTVTDLIVG